MKEFANISPRTVTKLTRQLWKSTNVVNAMDNDYAIITATEYIGEVFRDKYDHEDVNFVLDNLYLNPVDGTVYVLEMQGYPEEEQLVFEALYNPRWDSRNKWQVVLETNLCITEVDKMIAYSEQGWFNVGNFEHHSYMITLHNYLTVETDKIEQYVEAVNHIGGDIKIVDYYPVNTNTIAR